MSASKTGFRLGLQGKVLFAVMGFLIIVPFLSLWIVTDRMRNQMESEARSSVRSANQLFVRLLGNRNQLLTARYSALADDARVIVSMTDEAVAKEVMPGVLDKAPREDEGYVLVDRQGRRVSAVVQPDSPLNPDRVVQTGPAASPHTEIVALDGRPYSVVSVPVSSQQDPTAVAGSLLGAVALSDAVLQEAQPPGSTAFLVSGGKVIGATEGARALPPEIVNQLARTPPAAPEPMEIEGRHYMAQASALSDLGDSIQPVVLFSYEDQVAALESTQRQLFVLSVVGIVVSALFVSWFVRRLTRPLRELATTAEAVGRGDFSRRVTRYSDDECGELALAFNQMTTNLQGSRVELEKTVETLRTTQSQLIQSEKLSAVGQFVAGVAHELNNPLTAVIGFSDLLSQTAADQKIRPHLDLIAKSAHRCHKIVQNLLSFARQHPPERKLTYVSETIDEVLEIMAYDLRTSNITVVREFEDDLPAIMADPYQLQQVFVNILSNARQAIQPFRPDGRIVVRTNAAGAVVRLTFADNGPGIRPEHLSRIFDPFFTTKPVGKGTGLGMSLTYGIVHEHGGTISVASELGNGATFTIDLPVATERSASIHGVPAIRAASRPPIPGKSVLVVDDEDWILALTRALLEQDGYIVETAMSGEAAAQLLKARQFDVVVSDWKMPGMNGIQLYEHLCANNVVAASRMVFMTGDVISDTFQEFLQRNAKGCLAKPFAIGEFRSAVKAVVNAATA